MLWEKIPKDKIAIVAAHPDDEALGCGGTILKAVHEGKNVFIIFMTDGSASSFLKDKYETVVERINEVRKLYRTIGVKRIMFLGFPDGRLKNNRAKASLLLDKIFDIIEPDLVFTHYPDWHPDHKATFEIVNRVIEEKDIETYYFKVYSPKFFEKIRLAIDITDYYKKKIHLLRFYRSQFIYTIPHLLANLIDDVIFGWYYGKKVEVFL